MQHLLCAVGSCGHLEEELVQRSFYQYAKDSRCATKDGIITATFKLKNLNLYMCTISK